MFNTGDKFCRTGLVESKIRILIGKLEYNGGIELAHVNCKTFNPKPVTYVNYHPH